MKRITLALDRIFQRYTPDPLLIALGLTALVVLLAVTWLGVAPGKVVEAWGNGFWSLATFTLQMVMILVGGYLVADSTPVRRALAAIGRSARTPRGAALTVALVSLCACWVNWAFGLVAGAFLARELARAVPGASFRLLVAAAYGGFVVWHGGLSGSIPLLLNTPGNFSEAWVGGRIPLSRTLFAPFNLAAVAALALAFPIVILWLERHAPVDGPPPPLPAESDEPPATTPSQRWERHPWPLRLAGALGLAYVAADLAAGRFSLDLDRMNFLLLFTGMLLHGSVRSFGRALRGGAEKAGPLLAQYPLYGGLLGLMTQTGLAEAISRGFVSLASAKTFPLLAFYGAGVMNLFVPSGGGQWAVQGPLLVPAAKAVGADLPRTVMAVAWGDAWTNLLQPFWALPLLAIAGLTARDIMGYCVAWLVVSGAVLSLVFLL